MLYLTSAATILTTSLSVFALTGCLSSTSTTSSSENPPGELNKTVKEFFSLSKHISLTGQEFGLPIECAGNTPLQKSLIGDWVLTTSTEEAVLEAFVILESCLAADYFVGNEASLESYLPEGISLPNGEYTLITGITTTIDTGESLIFADYNNKHLLIDNNNDEVETSWNTSGEGGVYSYSQTTNDQLVLSDNTGSYKYHRK